MNAAAGWGDRWVAREWRWWLGLALPVLPLAGLLAHRATDWSAVNGLGLVILVGMGVWMALKGEEWMARCDRRVAKEVSVLRWVAWGVVGMGQVPMVLEPGNELGVTLFVGVLGGAILSAMPWGVEFQQRTLGHLMSQPWSRAEWWRLKMGVLAVVLGWTWGMLLASALVAYGSDLFEARVYGRMSFSGEWGMYAGYLLLLWAAVPGWTLLTRSALPGLVFAVAAPALALTGIAAVISLVVPEGREIPEGWGLGGVITLLAVYTIWSAGWSRRLWERMEAVDHEGAETGGLFLGRRASMGTGDLTEAEAVGTRATGRARPWWVQAAMKEVRLQAVSLVVLGMGMALVVMRQVYDWPVEMGSWISAVTVLIGSVGFLMAGVTSVAEERRLGVLEAQALWPVSRGWNWLVKMGVTLTVMGLALVVVDVGLRANLGPVSGGGRLVAAAIFAGLGSAALLVSSGAANGLRALLLTLGLTGVGLVMGFYLVKEVPRYWEQARYWDWEADRSDHLARWQGPARALEPAELERLGVWLDEHGHGGRWLKRDGGLIALPVVLGCVLAVGLAWRNYRRPGEAPRRILRQAVLCLGVFGVSAVVVALVIGQRLVHIREREMLVMTRSYLDWQDRLGSADRMLLERYPANDGKLWWVRGIWARFPQGKTAEPREGWVLRSARMFSGQEVKDLWYVPLPLNATNRMLLLERAELDPEIREALLREAATEE